MITSLCLSAAILIAIGVAYSFPRWWVIAPMVCVAIVLVGLGSPAVFVAAGGVLVVTCGCAFLRVRKARFWILATEVACLPYAVIAPSMFETYREVQQIRQDYPVQSLADRLEYEQPLRKAASNSSRQVVDPGRKPSAVEQRMIVEVQQRKSYQRQEALETLFNVHVEFASDFMNTEGQGDDRTPRRLPPRRAEVELPEPGPIPVAPEREQDATPSPGSTGEAEADPAIPSPADDQLTGFHAEGVVDFARPDSFGAMDWSTERRRPDLERVIGFQAHAFHRRPQLPKRRGATWKIEQLQLVSLLKHSEPAAYVSENLPRMEELREARTRPLTGFEASALEQLEAGEELVVHETRDTIEMLGALRAVRDCTNCHQVPRQTLLGAFTYRLRRSTPPTRL